MWMSAYATSLGIVFFSLSENKTDLPVYLSSILMDQAIDVPDKCVLVVAGGFEIPEKASSTIRGEHVQSLSCDHEEADMRMVFHGLDVVQSGHKHISFYCSDTYILLLLLHERMNNGWDVMCQTHLLCYCNCKQSIRADKIKYPWVPCAHWLR